VECLWIADGVIRRYVQDRTGGARNYYAPAAMDPPGRVPTWASGKPAKTIGRQVFLTA
jgi:hypothetical protein